MTTRLHGLQRGTRPTVVCTECSLEGTLLQSRCDACRGILEVATEGVGVPNFAFGMGEGDTPLLEVPRAGGAGVQVKLEGVNPTGSFKDRGAAVATAWAAEVGAAGVLCASTGNNAASVCAYAARSGLRAFAVVPHGATAAKLSQTLAVGAELLEVPGTFSDVHELVARVGTLRQRWVNLTSTFDAPLMTMAHKSIAYELAEELGDAPGSVLVPIGAGPMLIGIMAGFAELHSAGFTSRSPVPVGVQAAACSPIARAFHAEDDAVIAWVQDTTTVAQSIADPLIGYPWHGTHTLRRTRAEGGHVAAVSEEALRTAAADLGEQEGLVVEPAAAAPLAALRQLPDLPRPAVLVASGHGLKSPATLGQDARERRRPVAAPSVDAIVDLLDH